MGPLGVMITILVFYIQVYWRDLIRGVCTIFSVRLWNFKDGGSKKVRFLAKYQYTQRKPLYFENTGAQSICTHYFSFEKQGRFADLKKTGSKIWGAKSRVQKTGSMLFKKRKGQAVSSLFE